jgi:exopolysaccharide biosynthesis protein
MRVRIRLVSLLLLLCAATVPGRQAALGPAERIADGVLLYRLDDPALLDPPGPVAVQALRLDPRKVALEIGRGAGEEPPRTTVETIAKQRPGVIAAVNAGFFSLQTGRPTDFLKIDGEVVHGTARARGAVGIGDGDGTTLLLFDRVKVSVGNRRAKYSPLLGTSSDDWARASDAVGGAGLLRLDGRELSDWTEEIISKGFDTTRHPRTIIGTDTDGSIWLVTVDGRNLAISLGMSFAELQRLSDRLGLRSALNLDGGGSTTMWVAGKIVNHPSDAEGPRKVSDAILVVPRAQ